MNPEQQYSLRVGLWKGFNRVIKVYMLGSRAELRNRLSVRNLPSLVWNTLSICFNAD